MLAIYTRLSVEDDASNSIDNQLFEGKKFAKTHNHKDFKIFNEGEGLSGKLGLDDRPQLKELYEDIVNGYITIVWFRDQNRLSRNELLYHQFIELFIKRNISVYFGDVLFDTANPSTLVLGSIKATFDAFKVLEQSLATKKAIRNNVSEGKVHGIIPYGFTKDENRKLIIDEEEAEIIKRIYKLSLEGVGTNKIAEILNNDGVLTRYNKSYVGTYKINNKKNPNISIKNKKDTVWQGNTIRNLITNPIYKGERVFDEITYRVKEIVKKDYWEKVNDNLKKNRNNSGKSVKHKYLLKGILRCGKCGRNYYGRTRISKKDNYYMCSSKRYKNENCGNRSINIDKLEELVWTKFIHDGKLMKLVQEYVDNGSDKEILDSIKGDLKALNKRKEQIKQEQNKLIELALKGVFSDEDLRTKNNSLKIENNDVELKIANKELEIKTLSDLNKNIDSVLDELDISKELDFNSKKNIISKYVKNIQITYKSGYYLLDIDFNIEGMETFTYVFFKHYKFAHTFIKNNIKDVDVEIVILDSVLEKEYRKGDVKIDLLISE